MIETDDTWDVLRRVALEVNKIIENAPVVWQDNSDGTECVARDALANKVWMYFAHRIHAEVGAALDEGGEMGKQTPEPVSDLETELRNLLNRYSRENESNTPDYILADYLIACLVAFEQATKEREHWFGTKLEIKYEPDPQHNHTAEIIPAVGECPACDRYGVDLSVEELERETG